MSSAKKQIIEPIEEDSSDELGFDLKNDWRKVENADQTNIFKEDDLEIADEEMDTSIFSLDTKGEAKKDSIAEHTRAQREAMNNACRKKKGEKSDTLKALQDAAQGGEGEDVDELEILTEEDKALVSDPIFTNKGDQYPQIHGNYFLLDHLVDGGMAKVCRARYLGEGDEADKMVAIKMVQEKFSSDESFVQMFVDEIKVSFGLNHPNINTTFDYGKIGKNLFVSMEYIHGKDLMVVIDVLKKQKKTIPIPMAIFIASKMAEALHYAHNFTNQLTGQKYNIVHRDISPHNAMLSYDGFVKVIDFGIAKADTNSTEEEEGTIKGKINYFAPEYLEGKKIDHRYDQFAVALTLWEMLTGEKTFTGADQLLTLKTIMECEPKAPSRLNKKVPKKLDQIILKALSKEPDNRHKDMEAFNKALMKFLYQTYPDFHESDISKLMKTLFKSDYQHDLEKFQEFGKWSISDVVEKINAFKEFQQRQKEKAKNIKAREMEFDFGFEENVVSARAKTGLDKLVTGRKKEKPGKKKRDHHRSRQEALASMLDEEIAVESSLERNKGKIIFLGLLTLAFFQKELIYKTLFETGEVLSIENRTVIQEKKEELTQEIEAQRQKQRENMKFLKKLRAENEEEEVAEAPEPESKTKNGTQDQKAKPIQRVLAKENVQDSIKEEFNLQETSPAQKNTNTTREPIVPQVERTAPTTTVEVKASTNMAKSVGEESSPVVVEKKREDKVQEVSNTQSSAPVEDLSFEEMKKRMEQQLAEREKRLKREAEYRQRVIENKMAKPPKQEVRPADDTQNTPSVNTNALGVSATGGSGGQGSEGFTEELEGEMEKEFEGEQAETAKESLEEMMDSSRAENIENQLNKAQAEFKPEKILNESKDVLKKVAPQEASPVEAPSQSSPPQQPVAGATPTPKVEQSVEKELEALKAKMAKLKEEQEERARGPRIDKVKITIDEPVQEQAGVGESVKDGNTEGLKSEGDIQRELASRLKEMDEAPAQEQTGEEEGVVDGVVDFLKTRRAFSWMFDD